MFSEKEMAIIMPIVNKAYDEKKEMIKTFVHKQFDAMISAGMDPKERLAEIASQERWDGDHFGDHHPLPYGGGVAGCVFTNMFSYFGFNHDASQDYMIPCMILARVMKKNSDVDLFVRSVMSAAMEIHKVKKNRLDSENVYIYGLLRSLVD